MVATNFMTGIGWVSWSSIIAGVLTTFALWLVLAIIGLALGFKVVHPTSDHPVAGLGKTLGIWTVVMNVISYAGGGYMAGVLAGQNGLAHGFLVWAVVSIIMVLCSSHLVYATLRSFLLFAKGMGKGAVAVGEGVHHLSGGIAHAAGSVVQQLKENIDVDLNPGVISEKFNEKVLSVLRDTGNDKLQPENLKQQLKEARKDLSGLVRQLGLNPGKYDEIISAFLDKEKSRIHGLTGEFDRDTAVTTLMNHREIPREEAEKLVDNAVEAYYQATDKVEEAMEAVRENVEEAKKNIHEMADQARVAAESASNTIAKAAAGAAVALIVAAVICMGCGCLGVYCADKLYRADYVVVRSVE